MSEVLLPFPLFVVLVSLAGFGLLGLWTIIRTMYHLRDIRSLG